MTDLGIERTIRPAATTILSWPRLVERLAALGEVPVVRMIDGLPAFPDEVPADEWQELRLSLAGGMVTIRWAGADFRCVTWGTSDDALRQSWDKLCFAIATVVEGQIVEEGHSQTATDFATRVGLN